MFGIDVGIVWRGILPCQERNRGLEFLSRRNEKRGKRERAVRERGPSATKANEERIRRFIYTDAPPGGGGRTQDRAFSLPLFLSHPPLSSVVDVAHASISSCTARTEGCMREKRCSRSPVPSTRPFPLRPFHPLFHLHISISVFSRAHFYKCFLHSY